MAPFPVIFVILLACATPVRAELVAERITSESLEGWHVGGPDRDAGVGDWALGNGTVCIAVTDPSHEGMIFASGGNLVDVGRCGREDDQWTTLEMMWNLDRHANLVVTQVEAGQDENRAWILTKGTRDGIEVETRYFLERDGEVGSRNFLGVELRVRRVGEGGRFSGASLLTVHPTGQTRPFSLFRRVPEKSVGFAYPESDPNSTMSLLRAIIPADLHVFVGPEGVPGISYGLEFLRGERIYGNGDPAQPLPMMSTTGADSTLTGFFSEPFWVGSGDPPGLLELAQTPFMDLAIGDRLELDWRLWVSDRADVASITDLISPGEPRISGEVDDRNARVYVDTADGRPATVARSDEHGHFSFRVPTGQYNLTVRSPGRPDVTRDLTVTADDQTLPLIEVGPPAVIELPRGKRMRLVFQGVDRTRDPIFGDDLIDFRVGNSRMPTTQEARDISLAGLPSDPTSVVVRPGRYRVTATRGPEFALTRTEITTTAGETTRLDIPEPLRALETAGWISADLHVHTDRSFDTVWPVNRQVSAFAAEGAEVLVATEHDRVFDPRPAIARLGLEDSIVGVPGVEVTSVAETDVIPHTLGHLNAFPVERTDGYRGGAPAGEGRRLRAVLADLHEVRAFTQLNHPRTMGRAAKGAYFMHLGVPGEEFEPEEPLTEEPNRVLLEEDPRSGVRDLDFDGLEGLNGENFDSYRRVRADWFSLLRQGERKTLTANSDSHRASQVVALPRTYVRVEGDSVASFDRAEFLRALRDGRAFGTTGPMLDVRLGNAGIGDTHTGGAATLVVVARAAPWIPVEEVRVYVDGALVARRAASSGEPVEFPLEFESDAFVTVEVEGPENNAYLAVAPGFVPFAFTNPIFVDANGDGVWTPPGLSGLLPETITSPDEAS